jgi:hypothetical protein
MRLPSDDISCRPSQLVILQQILIEIKLSKKHFKICGVLFTLCMILWGICFD